MNLLRTFLFNFKKIILSPKANFSIFFSVMFISILLVMGILMYVLDYYHKKNAMENANTSAILSGASKMISRISYFGDNMSSHTHRAIVDDVTRFIKNYIKEALLMDSSVFNISEKNIISQHSKVSITREPHSNVFHELNNQSVLQNKKIFYHMSVETFYDYHVKFFDNLLNKKINTKIISFVPALVKIDTEEYPPFFVQLVVDLSASMSCLMDSDPEHATEFSICGKSTKNSKMDALKKAVLLFLDSVDRGSKTQKDTHYIGLTGYTTRVEKNIEPSWGTGKVRKYIVEEIDANMLGQTDSTPAMKKAYQILTSDKKRNFIRNILHKRTKIPFLPFQKFLIFLTDGENNDPKSDMKTIKICEKAKKNSIKILTISINASSNGKRLLKKCVSAPEYYYNVVDTGSLLRVFQEISTLITHYKYQVILKR
ncbi:von Willebrand factor A [Candidatus Liberibacter solanacearum]|uniref:VWFA domain-containing protein n=1 Tax=Candidatus Liberibacter solanacearum TaxID=556287 RepID=A0A094Z270_9HYPH|nr:vWA domain-containing protein [Candidatus Liberibacter solanacearum]KGB27722.1 von Willebrand factor A [Candidatus Liberibacter solanacearum]KJZ81487.1 von Willebrand factor A [Candidatus Liberibacter solanacearum]KJZ82632.1 hypothetical protein DJ66_0241 [Candidatus Liberibacter solanacearum]KQC49125.1 hypothetical protein AP064_03465 [Candidatus Liberibacter solanacearum]